VSESTMRSRIIRALKPLDAVPIENKLAAGTPDVNYSGGWIELKWIRAWKKNADTSPVLLPHYTKNQRLWMRRRTRRSGISLLMLQVQTEWFVFDSDFAYDHIGITATRLDMRANAVAHWPKGLNERELVTWLRSLNSN
jgi:hypothetical protein